jgi:hypothetical protein
MNAGDREPPVHADLHGYEPCVITLNQPRYCIRTRMKLAAGKFLENKLWSCCVGGRYRKIGLVMSAPDIGTGRGWGPWGACGGYLLSLQPWPAGLPHRAMPTRPATCSTTITSVRDDLRLGSASQPSYPRLLSPVAQSHGIKCWTYPPFGV